MKAILKEKTKEKGIRINTIIKGEPASWLSEWKKRGIVLSNTDAVVQAFRAFNEKLTEQDLKSTQLRNIKSENEF